VLTGPLVHTLPLSVSVAFLTPREQAYENPSSITLTSFGIGHCRGPKNNNFYHSEIGCVGTAVPPIIVRLQIRLHDSSATTIEGLSSTSCVNSLETDLHSLVGSGCVCQRLSESCATL
jgi:hypothetical protein